MKLSRRFEDLRFVIGLFFAIISVIVLLSGFMAEEGAGLNLGSGAVMGGFAAVMITLSFLSPTE